jgi:hypothetical protein
MMKQLADILGIELVNNADVNETKILSEVARLKRENEKLSKANSDMSWVINPDRSGQ